jgi:hypothetical protein
MKRKPHFKYFWEVYNNHAIVANVRTNYAFRHTRFNCDVSAISSENFWDFVIDDEYFPITRAQFRLFKSEGVIPTFSHYNHRIA